MNGQHRSLESRVLLDRRGAKEISAPSDRLELGRRLQIFPHVVRDACAGVSWRWGRGVKSGGGRGRKEKEAPKKWGSQLFDRIPVRQRDSRGAK